MIFLTVGTHEEPFDRIIDIVDNFRKDAFIQYGYSKKPENCKCAKLIDFMKMEVNMKNADVVITHAGTGCVMLALSLGRKPIVIPRYKKFNEHVDDHQLELVEQLAENNLIIPFYDGDNFEDKYNEAIEANKVALDTSRPIEDKHIFRIINDFIDGI